MELEQMLAGAIPRNETIDTYMAEPGLYSGMPTGIGSGMPTSTSPATELFPSAPLRYETPNIGSFPTAPGCGGVLRQTYELDEDVGLQERLDFSGHNDTPAHLNYDLGKINEDGILEAKKDMTKMLKDMHYFDLD